MDLSEVPVGSIVVGVDGSPCSDRAVEWAADQAELERRPLTVVHAQPAADFLSSGMYASTGVDLTALVADARDSARALLDEAVSRVRERAPSVVVHDVLYVEDPSSLLLELSGTAAMVVVGSRGRGPVATLLLGSVSVSVSRHANCPVVVIVGSESRAEGHRMVVGTDGTERSRAAVEFAFRMASSRHSHLTVVQALAQDGPVTAAPPEVRLPHLEAEREHVSASLTGLAEKFPEVQVSVELVTGSVRDRLVAASADHDLVVVGHQEVGRVVELIRDSTSAGLLEHAAGSIAVVPSHPGA